MMTPRSSAASVALAAPIAADATRLDVRAARVAAIAANHAEAVDRDGRFPTEAMAALRGEALLSLLVPRRLDGEEAALSEVAEICYALGRACASTAMIFAMHQIKAACIVRHGQGAPWHEAFMRAMVRDQLLLASSTTEGRGGGAVRTSVAAVMREGGDITLDRAATVMSYGEQADAVVTTARRTAAAAATDQVLVVLRKGDYTLERTSDWDTLGMRGTASAGFTLRARGVEGQILPESYGAIHAQTMTPTAHILWSAVWSGVAAAAYERARMFLRRAARQAAGQLPPGAAHLGRAAASLRALRALLGHALERYELAIASPETLAGFELQSALTLLKVDASELAVETVQHALRTCGLSGYRNDGDASIGRHLRDILSAPLMINNDRIVADAAAGLLLTPAPKTLR